MGQPISWRNIDAPDLRGASAILGQAQSGITAGFGKFNDILKSRQAMEEANWQQAKENNTQAAMDVLYGAKTPEELAAKQALLQEMRSGFGAQVDRAALRNAEDGRLATLQQRQKQETEFNNFMLDQKQEPIREAFKAAVLKGDKDAQNALIEANPNLRHMSDLLSYARDKERQTQTWNQQDQEFANKAEKHGWEREENPIKLANLRKDGAVKDAQAASLRASADQAKAYAEKARRPEKDDDSPSKADLKARDAALEELKKNSHFSAGTLDTREGMDYFVKWVNDNVKNNSEKADILYNIGKSVKDGIEVAGGDGKRVKAPLPVAAAIQSILASTDSVGLIPGWSRRGDDADNLFRKYLQDNIQGIQADYDALRQASGNKIEAGFKAIEPKTETILDTAVKRRLKNGRPVSYPEAGLNEAETDALRKKLSERSRDWWNK